MLPGISKYLLRNLKPVAYHLISLNYKATRSVSYFITTPIFYVNSSPHIGHVHSLLLADAINIYHRLKFNSRDTIFSTGTDEHGIKVQTAAECNKVDYDSFCDSYSKKFKTLFDQYDTTLTDFVRTTEDRHRKCVEHVWNSLKKNDLIYKSSYSGWYCSSEETFVPESQISKIELNGEITHFDQDGNRVSWSSEENYMFKLSLFKDDISKWLTESKPVIPNKFNEEALNVLKLTEMKDISISRPTKRLNWGIRVPDDPDQTIYVWLDALSSYLTVSGFPCEDFSHLKRWPVDCHIIGKDIIKFHTIYWPSFILGLGLSLPRKILCHSHWLIDSLKMSKSRGNVVDPFEENKFLSSEGLRYYLLRSSTPHSDNDYDRTNALNRVNSELADTYGNLMSRCCAPAINPDKVIPTNLVGNLDERSLELLEKLDHLAKKCGQHYENGDIYKVVDDVMAVLRLVNGIYENSKPWKLFKEISTDNRSLEAYTNLQALTFESLRICSIILQPVVPKITAHALGLLNSKGSWRDARVSIRNGSSNTSHNHLNDKEHGTVLFRRIK